MLGSMRNVLLDADGAGGRVEAFAVCDATWGELARAAGQQVFEWGAAAWVDARLWSFSSVELRLRRPRRFDLLEVYSVVNVARERGYPGPDSLAALLDWVGVPYQAAQLVQPLDRCLLTAAALRAPALRGVR